MNNGITGRSGCFGHGRVGSTTRWKTTQDSDRGGDRPARQSTSREVIRRGQADSIDPRSPSWGVVTDGYRRDKETYLRAEESETSGALRVHGPVAHGDDNGERRGSRVDPPSNRPPRDDTNGQPASGSVGKKTPTTDNLRTPGENTRNPSHAPGDGSPRGLNCCQPKDKHYLCTADTPHHDCRYFEHDIIYISECRHFCAGNKHNFCVSDSAQSAVDNRLLLESIPESRRRS